MKKGKKKKYSLGTGKNGVVRNYIESPSETLIENDIAMAKAKEKASNNGLANGLDILGNMALQYGMGKAGGSKGVGKGIGQGFGNIFGGGNTAAFGGPVGIGVEVEGKEVGETPGGQLIDFQGPSHENGGIDVDLPPGTEIFSKRIKVKGKTMAERKMAREKKVLTLEKLLEKTGEGDVVLMNSLKRTKTNNEKEQKKDQHLQDVIGGMEKLAQFAYGTNSEGIQKFNNGGTVLGDLFKSIFGGQKQGDPKFDENGILDLSNVSFDSDNASNDLGTADSTLTQGMNTFTEGDKMTIGQGEPDAILPDGKNNNIPNFTGGDLIGLAGTAFSAFEPMKNTQANRAGDTPNINAFKDFGNDAIDRIDEAKGYIGSQRDDALNDLETSRTGVAKRNRNSARGVNTLRALDTASDMNINQAQGDIYDTFSKQMMGLLSQQAGFENAQDSAVMQGEQNRDLADRQDRDNYYTQLAEDISTKGEGIQTIGKMVNQNKANSMAEQAVNDSSINFQYDNGTLTDKAGNVVMTEAEILKSAQVLGITPEEYINLINKQK